MGKSTTVGDEGYEDLLAAWLAKGKPYQIVESGVNYKCYPSDEAVTFVVMPSGFDANYGKSSVPAAAQGGVVEEKPLVPSPGKRNRRPEGENAPDGSGAAPGTPDVSGGE